MAEYSIGIDLGTTHSALATLQGAETIQNAEQSVLPIPQLIKPGVIEERQLLPSFLYLPNENEFPAGSLELPWGGEGSRIVGEFARAHGAKSPTRLVSSAKSWLCHPGVDRTGAILPWQAPCTTRAALPTSSSENAATSCCKKSIKRPSCCNVPST